MFWREFESLAPELARAGRERLERTHVALLGTLRPDGSPRISPIEPYFLAQHLVLGAMRSAKASDLARDHRCALHSVVTDINASEGEFQLRGTVADLDREDLHGTDSDAWWAGRPAGSYRLYAIDVEGAVLVQYDVPRAEMRVVRWSPDAGVTESRRAYP